MPSWPVPGSEMAGFLQELSIWQDNRVNRHQICERLLKYVILLNRVITGILWDGTLYTRVFVQHTITGCSTWYACFTHQGVEFSVSLSGLFLLCLFGWEMCFVLFCFVLVWEGSQPTIITSLWVVYIMSSEECGDGKEWNDARGECEPCDINYYKTASESFRCQPCPANIPITDSTGSTSVDNCRSGTSKIMINSLLWCTPDTDN